MARTATFQLRLSEEEMTLLRSVAAAKGWSVAQVVRDLIRTLSAPPSHQASATRTR